MIVPPNRSKTGTPSQESGQRTVQVGWVPSALHRPRASSLPAKPGGPAQSPGVVGSHVVQVRGGWQQEDRDPADLKVSRRALAALYSWFSASKLDIPGRSPELRQGRPEINVGILPIH